MARVGNEVRGSFVDPGDGQTWTGTINFNDGVGERPLPLNADKSFAFPIPFGATGRPTVTIRDNQGNTGIGELNDPFKVNELIPRGGDGTTIDSVDLVFSRTVNVTSFTLADLALTGPNGTVPVTGVVPLSEKSLRVSFAPQRLNGTYTLTVGPEIKDGEQQPLDQNGDGSPDAFVGTFSVSLPNLVAGGFSASPTSPLLDNTVTVTWTTTNSGTRAITNAWTESLYLSKTGVIDGTSVLLSSSTRAAGLAVGASVGGSSTVALPLRNTLPDGDYFFVLRVDDGNAVTESDEANDFASGVVTIVRPTLGDLALSNVAPGAATASPGETLALTYRVSNPTAVPVTGTCREQIFLSSDGTLANSQRIAELTRTGPLTGDVDHSETVTLPTSGPFSSGNLRLLVVVDAFDDVVEADEANNLAVSAATIDVRSILTFTVSATGVAEIALNPLRGTIVRSGSVSDALTVTLSNNKPGELIAPATVVIPAGQNGVSFDLRPVSDQTPDGDQLVNLLATATGFDSASVNVTVRDTDQATFTFTLDSSSLQEGNSRQVTLTRSRVTDQSLLVTLTNNSTGQVSIPATVVIPTGMVAATFTVATLQDNVPEKSSAVRITATGVGYAEAFTEPLVTDDDLPTLSLQLSSNVTSENAGPQAVRATLTRALVTDQPLTVRLKSSNPAEATVPATVIVPANQASVSFDIAAVNDGVLDGVKQVDLTANGVYPSCGCTISGGATATLTVQDSNSPGLSVVIVNDVLAEGSTLTGTVTRSGDRTQALTVSLSSSDPTEATVPTTVVIAAGQTSATFTLTAVEDNTPDGNQSLTITASGVGLESGSASPGRS